MTQEPPHSEEQSVELEGDEFATVAAFFTLAVKAVADKMLAYGGRADVDVAVAIRFHDVVGEWRDGWFHIRSVGPDPAALIAFYEEAIRQVKGWDTDPDHVAYPPIDLNPL